MEHRVADWMVNQQLQSPLYDRLRPEIGLPIFKINIGQYYGNSEQ